MATRVLHGNLFFEQLGRAVCKENPCKVSTNLAKWFRRCCLKKLLTFARMDGCTDGRWTTDKGPSQKFTLKALSSGELKSINII